MWCWWYWREFVDFFLLFFLSLHPQCKVHVYNRSCTQGTHNIWFPRIDMIYSQWKCNFYFISSPHTTIFCFILCHIRSLLSSLSWTHIRLFVVIKKATKTVYMASILPVHIWWKKADTAVVGCYCILHYAHISAIHIALHFLSFSFFDTCIFFFFSYIVLNIYIMYI